MIFTALLRALYVLRAKLNGPDGMDALCPSGFENVVARAALELRFIAGTRRPVAWLEHHVAKAIARGLPPIDDWNGAPALVLRHSEVFGVLSSGRRSGQKRFFDANGVRRAWVDINGLSFVPLLGMVPQGVLSLERRAGETLKELGPALIVVALATLVFGLGAVTLLGKLPLAAKLWSFAALIGAVWALFLFHFQTAGIDSITVKQCGGENSGCQDIMQSVLSRFLGVPISAYGFLAMTATFLMIHLGALGIALSVASVLTAGAAALIALQLATRAFCRMCNWFHLISALVLAIGLYSFSINPGTILPASPGLLLATLVFSILPGFVFAARYFSGLSEDRAMLRVLKEFRGSGLRDQLWDRLEREEHRTQDLPGDLRFGTNNDLPELEIFLSRTCGICQQIIAWLGASGLNELGLHYRISLRLVCANEADDALSAEIERVQNEKGASAAFQILLASFGPRPPKELMPSAPDPKRHVLDVTPKFRFAHRDLRALINNPIIFLKLLVD
ncbi:MAG: vitamin K epoxide reductase family protein [Pseudomonadota bacterium]